MKVFRTGGIFGRKKDFNSQILTLNKEKIKIPTEMAEFVYEMYCKENGDRQSFEQMHERGGFGTVETVYYLFTKILELKKQINVAVDFTVPKERHSEFWEYFSK